EKLRYDELDPAYYEGFENLNRHNLISFKSFHEVFNVTALEEFHGYFTSYRKEKDISEKDKDRINLYAVTNHFPRDLFAPFRGTEFLECIREGLIYELRVLTPVRFIITRKSTHPILGLFSDDPEQIMTSRRHLEKDRWLLSQVSSYFKKLYNYYFQEGFDMAYTEEMFIKEHYPEWYEKIQMAETKGVMQGELIGEILLAQRILKQSVYSREQLESKSIDELKSIFAEIETKLNITCH
ncbi:MAG: hypothetical protein GY795_31065, partial [Desulfobacterales bacterium]|nr:hypothetical protein [Desulfobacterales bacterium]